MFDLAYTLFKPGEENMTNVSKEEKQRARLNSTNFRRLSTLHIIIMYFLPGIDRQAFDGKVIALSTLGNHSIILVPPSTRIGDGVFIPYSPNLQHLFHVMHPFAQTPETHDLVCKAKKLLKEVWTKPPIDVLNIWQRLVWGF